MGEYERAGGNMKAVFGRGSPRARLACVAQPRWNPRRPFLADMRHLRSFANMGEVLL